MTKEELIEEIEGIRSSESNSEDDDERIRGNALWLLGEVRAYLTSLSAAHTIKPLVWEDGENRKSSRSGPYSVYFHDFGGTGWSCLFNAWKEGEWGSECNSMDHGKQLCQQHHESEAGIGKYLERVR